MKTLTKNLFKTFIISIVISSAINGVYYAITQRGTHYDYGHAINLIVSGALLLNVILVIMSLPSLFLGDDKLWNSKLSRLFLYFTGSLVFFVTVFFMKLGERDRLFYVINGAVFIIVHTIFYLRIVKKGR